MKSIRNIFIGLGILTVVIGLHAQMAVQSFQDIEPVGDMQPTAPDSVVQIAAEAQGLTLIARADLPRSGTYWVVLATGAAVPLPCVPNDASLPVYGINERTFLVDGTGGQVAVNRLQTRNRNASTLVYSALETQASAVVNLIAQVQEVELNRELNALFSIEEETPSNDSPMMMVDPNGLWLEITHVANGFSFGNLHNGTNQVYQILGSTNLLDPNWSIEGLVCPTDTNCQPFTVANQNRDILFLRVRDWTGVDEDADGLADWWEWYYFGMFALSATDTDAASVLLGEDFTNSAVPTVFQFSSVTVTNQYVSSSPAPVTLNVAGYPYYIAVLVDDTNFANAVWQDYNGSTVAVNLGSTEGWHEVWIGLRGHADAPSAAAWQWKRLKLDTTPPQLVITGPTNDTVDVPVIQITGFSPEALASLRCVFTNDLGVVTEVEAGISDQHYDVNTREFTTNDFECLDVPLTNGVNLLTLQATDLAGNVTTANFSYTVNYSEKTNPVVQLIQPQDGMRLAGNSFTLCGQVDDPTVMVTATITVTNGTTNTVSGLVERSGRFWLENLPLNSGTNVLSITVSNVVGLTTVTNLNLVQSDQPLTINAVSDASQLWQPTVDLSGTLAVGDDVIWVNGVMGTNYGDGTWSATNVPVSAGGVASFQVTAYPANEAPAADLSGGGTNPLTPNALNVGADPDKPAYLYVVSYTNCLEQTVCSAYTNYYDNGSVQDWGHFTETVHDELNWQFGRGGFRDYYDDRVGAYQDTPYSQHSPYHVVWPATGNGVASGYWDGDNQDGKPVAPPVPPWEAGTLKYVDSQVRAGINYRKDYGYTAQTKIHLRTGGKGKSGRQNLFRLGASATSKHYELVGNPVTAIYEIPEPVLPQNIRIDGKPLGSDGNQWRIYADNRDIDVTPRVLDKDYYTFTNSQQKYLSYFDVYVLEGNPGGFSPIGEYDEGHAWWALRTEAPQEALNYLSLTNQWYLAQRKYGYYPTTFTLPGCLWCPGQLQVPEPHEEYTVKRSFYIGFNQLINAIEFTRGLRSNPGTYVAPGHNCVQAVREAAVAAGGGQAQVSIWPQYFGMMIELMYPNENMTYPHLFLP